MNQFDVRRRRRRTAKKAAEAKPLDQEMKTLDGKKVNLAEKYKGKVVLLVNVASKCGYTPQYEQLQALHEKYAQEGPGDRRRAVQSVRRAGAGHGEGNRRVLRRRNYGVEFDMMAKVDVNGERRRRSTST